MGSEQNRFGEEQEQERGERGKRWGGCLMCCLGLGGNKGGGGKRIVPATRLTDTASSSSVAAATQAQAHQPHSSLLAPPSSPASFTNSALPSTVQSPACFPSPGGPSNQMFATGPYAGETQLVSPPVFSTFTTEPSTAPLTPPPELAHLTTPSSPDVPFARFLSSDSNSNFFCPETFAQYYLENPQAGGRLSVSKDSSSSDLYTHQHQQQQQQRKQQDPDEIEAYRASFGFSADEIVTTAHFVEISPDTSSSSFTLLKPLKTSTDEKRYLSDEDDIFANMGSNRKYHVSTSDAEIDYRRGRSLRHTQ